MKGFHVLARACREHGERGRVTVIALSPEPPIAKNGASLSVNRCVVLHPDLWASWIYLSKPESELLRPLPAWSLHVENVLPASD